MFENFHILDFVATFAVLVGFFGGLLYLAFLFSTRAANPLGWEDGVRAVFATLSFGISLVGAALGYAAAVGKL